MKNIFKVFSIIAMSALIAVSFTACQDDQDPGDDGVQKTLVITDIPATLDSKPTNGKQMTVAIGAINKQNKLDIVALDQLDITGTTVTSKLVSGNEKKKGGAFTGTGDFYIFLFIDFNGTTTGDNQLDDDIIYSYGAGSKIDKQTSITTATTTIGFDQFFKRQ